MRNCVTVSVCVCLCVVGGLGCGVIQFVRIMRIIVKTDAASRILSAATTVPGSLLSPPVFGCHGDDVKLHHRFSPVDGPRGVATRRWSAGAIIRESSLLRFPSPPRSPSHPLIPKCAKLCICKPVSAETRSEPRYL